MEMVKSIQAGITCYRSIKQPICTYEEIHALEIAFRSGRLELRLPSSSASCTCVTNLKKLSATKFWIAYINQNEQ